jgi:hypothetical protein
MDYSDCAGNSVGPERAPKKAKRSVNECVLVSGSPFFLVAIAENSKWPGLYSLFSLFRRELSDFIGEDLTDCLKANELAGVHRRSLLLSVNDLQLPVSHDRRIKSFRQYI